MRAIVAVTIALACQRAQAESPPAGSPQEPPAAPVVASYRSSILAMDSVALAQVVVGEAADAQFLVVTGVLTYALAPPLTHMTNGRNGHAGASIAMRLSLPLLGVVIAEELPRDCGPSGDCIEFPRPAVLIGFGVGVVAASALDVILLAKGDPRPSQPHAAWTPVATPTRGGIALGIAAQF